MKIIATNLKTKRKLKVFEGTTEDCVERMLCIAMNQAMSQVEVGTGWRNYIFMLSDE